MLRSIDGTNPRAHCLSILCKVSPVRKRCGDEDSVCAAKGPGQPLVKTSYRRFIHRQPFIHELVRSNSVSGSLCIALQRGHITCGSSETQPYDRILHGHTGFPLKPIAYDVVEVLQSIARIHLSTSWLSHVSLDVFCQVFSPVDDTCAASEGVGADHDVYLLDMAEV